MSTPLALESLMERALEGEREAVAEFFRILLGATVTVPRRFQHLPLSDSPQYPSDLFDILGIKHGERVLVPVFTRAELVRRWASAEFVHREFQFRELLNTIPDQWWVVINPGMEVEKELSPWELQQLRDGEEGIEPVLEEILSATTEEPVKLEPLSEEEEQRFRPAVLPLAEAHPTIEKIFILKNPLSKRYLVEISFTAAGQARGEGAGKVAHAQEEVQNALAPLLIGSEWSVAPLREIGVKADWVQSLLNNYQPIWVRSKRSFFRGLFR